MKLTIVAGIILGMSNMALAADAPKLNHRFTEYATVIDVEPVYKRVRHDTPARECYTTEVYEDHTYNQRESRRNSRKRHSSNNSYNSSNGGEAILGGLIGGIVGNQLGKNAGKGARTGATVAGAIVGSVIANEARGSSSGEITRHRNNRRSSNSIRSGNQYRGGLSYRDDRTSRHNRPSRQVERCKEVTRTSYKRELRAYDVTYQYRGKLFSTRMNRDPGERIELQVNVSPARQ